MLVRFADLVAIPYPIVLVLGGLGIGALPGGPQLELDPDVVFLVFLPPLLQSAAYWTSPQELWAELAPLTGLVLGLSLGSMLVVAAVSQAVIPEPRLAGGAGAGSDRRSHRPRRRDRDLRAGRGRRADRDPGRG